MFGQRSKHLVSSHSGLISCQQRWFAVMKMESTEAFNELITPSSSNVNKLIVVDYKADWCGPCRKMTPLFEELSEQYKTAEFVSVDCDELPDLAAQRGVSSLPTFEFIKNGKSLLQVIGANPSRLEQAVMSNVE